LVFRCTGKVQLPISAVQPVSVFYLCALTVQVAVFAPTKPVALVHLLVIPLHHIKNTDSLTVKDLPLLKHMYNVGVIQLNAHAPYYVNQRPMRALAMKPPYDYDQGQLTCDGSAGVRGGSPTIVAAEGGPSSNHCDHQAATAISAVVSAVGYFLGFHVGGFNSIDHLHLHVQ
jgi:hypothetical protein